MLDNTNSQLSPTYDPVQGVNYSAISDPMGKNLSDSPGSAQEKFDPNSPMTALERKHPEIKEFLDTWSKSIVQEMMKQIDKHKKNLKKSLRGN